MFIEPYELGIFSIIANDFVIGFLEIRSDDPANMRILRTHKFSLSVDPAVYHCDGDDGGDALPTITLPFAQMSVP